MQGLIDRTLFVFVSAHFHCGLNQRFAHLTRSLRLPNNQAALAAGEYQITWTSGISVSVERETEAAKSGLDVFSQNYERSTQPVEAENKGEFSLAGFL